MAVFSDSLNSPRGCAHWIYNPGGNVTVDLDGHEVALCFSSSSVARLAA